MKTKILLFISLVLLAVQGLALPVDESSARAIVQDFVIEKRGINPNSVPTTSSSDLQLLHAEMSSVNVTMNAYYIFNTGDGFVIVAGDDRAEQILGYGDGELDMNDIPCGMQFMLDSYKEQIDYLFEHPGLVVETPSMNAPRLSASNVAPMLTAKWGQRKPYYNLTPTVNGTHCKTGCSCVALCQVMHYWKKPITPVPSLPSYISSFRGVTITVPELPSDKFHWNYIKDSYSGSYTADEAYSVAKLMRYVGQAEHMGYTTEASGASTDDILYAAKLFGYNRNAKRLDRDDYTDAEWAALILAELNAGRPIVYTGFNSSHTVGHAFNLDGYRASDKKYHINWGFNGNSNGYYALNAFNPPNNNFNYMQDMIVGLEPQNPEIVIITPATLSFSAKIGETKTATFRIKGCALTGDLTLKLNNGGNIYSIDKTSITMSDAAYEATVTVTYKPTQIGTSNASVTISGGGAPSKSVSLIGTANPVSTISVNPSSLTFNAVTGETKTATFLVKCPNAINNLSLKLNNGGNIYSIDKTSISKNNAISGTTVTVTYSPTVVGTSSASITISGGGANPITVPLNGTAVKPEITLTPSSLSFSAINGETKTTSFTVKCAKANADLNLTLNNSGNIYSIDKTNITKSEAINGTSVTVTYCPTEAGTSSASVIVSGGGADPKTVSLNGTAVMPEITVNPSSLSFVAYTGETVTKTFKVTTNFSTSDLSLKMNDSTGIYSIDKTSISKNEAIQGSVVTVSYNPTEAGTSNASITISGGDAQPRTVNLSGNSPEITVTPTSLDFGQVKLNETKSLTFSVTGAGLTGDLTVSSSNSHLTVSPATITASEAARGAIVTVTFKPTSSGTINTSITVSGGGAISKKINLSGKGINPTITVGLDSWSFSTYPNQIVGKTFSVRGNDLTGDLTLSLNDTAGVYSIDKTVITQSEAMSNVIPQVTVTYAPTEVGASTASIIISGGGADPKTISLNGSAIAEIWVSPASINFVSMYNNIHVGDTIKRSFNVNGKGLTGDLTICLNDDSGNYSIDKTSISMSEAVSGPVVTVTYAPTEAGTSNASVTVSGGGAEPKTVTISGTAVKPEITVDPSSLSFVACPGETVTRSFIVTGNYLAAGLRLSLNDDSGIFSIDKRSIGRSDAANGDTVTVTYSPTEVGTSSAYVTISGGGYGNLIDADPVTVILSGTAADPFISVNTELMSFNTYTGHPLSKTFTVSGTILSDLSLALNDSSGAYSIDKTIITPAEASGSASVTVTYNPTADGSHNASITISGGGAEAKTVALEGCAVSPGIPEITTDVSAVTFESTYTGYQSSRTITITCPNQLNDLQLSLVRDNTSSFGLSKQTITPEEAAAGAKVTVYFSPTSGGAKHATLSIKSDGVETVSIPINGTGIKSDGYITAWPTNLSFGTQVGTPVTQTFKVTYSSANGGGVVMISSVSSGDDMAFDSKGGNEGSMLNLNAVNSLSNLTRTKIPFDRTKLIVDSIKWRPIVMDSLPLVLIKSLVLELTGDDCFDITPKKIRLSSVPCSAYVTVTYNPECVGEHDATIKINLSLGSARPFTLHLHGTATDQFDAPSFDNDGNDLMITQGGSSINSLVDEMLMNIKVYAESQTIIIESPVEQSAIISDIYGHAWSVSLQAGRNEIPVNASGIYIVRIHEKTTKLMLK